jgi:hypothetical protein
MLARTIVFTALVLAFVSFSKTAGAVTRTAPAQASDQDSALTTTAAVRARTDVQIRRIKSLIVKRQVNQEAAYEQLERLQKNLRGQN